MTQNERPERPPTLRAWHLAVLVPLLALGFRLGLPTPRALTADEVDTLRGGHRLVDLLTAPDHDPRLSAATLKERLLAGFAPAADHPRAPLVGDNPTRRAVLEAPLPRWIAALGIGVLPVTASMTNLDRAATASALVTSLALTVLLWTFRRRRPAFLLGLTLAFLTLPPVWEAASSAGYGASGLLAGALFVAALDRLVASGRGSLGVGLALGLTLAVHPLAAVLAITVFVAWAMRPDRAEPASPVPAETPTDGTLRMPATDRGTLALPATDRGTLRLPATDRGTLRLPTAPISLFLVPLVGLLALVTLWPALWLGTGKRLGAWLIDFGTFAHPTHAVLGVTYAESHRAAQAFTALHQWVVWTPLPLLGLWLLGFLRALRRGDATALLPPITLASLLAAASLDGSLFGARLSLLPLVLVPTVLTAALGFEVLAAGDATNRRRLALVALVFAIPATQAVRGSTLGLARDSGAELRFALPVALLEEAARQAPHAAIAVTPYPEHWQPALEAAREDLELDLEPTSPATARWMLTAQPPGDPAAPGDEVARDARTGLRMTLWRLGP